MYAAEENRKLFPGRYQHMPLPLVGIIHCWKKKPLQHKGQHRAVGGASGIDTLFPKTFQNSRLGVLGNSTAVLGGEALIPKEGILDGKLPKERVPLSPCHTHQILGSQNR